ncbi:MAG: PIG-L family deacetylase [Chloroflexi bacterium]|nr:PIG-L family deacetylase [Chloroflexota bacterium]
MTHVAYDSIYLSPHLDDATLSCGGQIFQQTTAGQRVLIVTITAGDPAVSTVSEYAQSLHTRWELVVDAVDGRRAEDIVASQILGADTLHWAVPDCIYRYHPDTGAPFYVSDADIFGEVAPAELNLINDLARQMAALPTAKQIVVPLTIGHHVDHQLTRAAAELCFNRQNLVYYEDYPYAEKAGALEAVLAAAQNSWQAEVIPLSEAAIQAKIEAIFAFKSQLSTFFDSRAHLAQRIADFTAAVGGERIWRK